MRYANDEPIERVADNRPGRNGVSPELQRKALEKALLAAHDFVPWHRLPDVLAILSLDIFRTRLREGNLIDAYARPEPARTRSHSRALDYRPSDGRGNDPGLPEMGAADTRFGRNMPDTPTGDADLPSPQKISDTLLHRERFIPAEGLNVIAAAWVQFQVHEWFAHKPDRSRNLRVGAHEVPGVPASLAERGARASRWFVNTETHWWDASQIYGSREELTSVLRAPRGELRMVRDAQRNLRLPQQTSGAARGRDLTGFDGGYWAGLSLLHTLFALEHNAICRGLRRRYKGLSDEDVFRKARLINAAVIAKIHTREWSTAILPHRPTRLSLLAQWDGFEKVGVELDPAALAAEINELPLPAPLKDRLAASAPLLVQGFANLPDEARLGLPGRRRAFHGTPFSLTEEFAAVYRMHPLMPDTFRVRDPDTGRAGRPEPFEELSGARTYEYVSRHGPARLWYSFATAPSGALTLHNFPVALRKLTNDDGVTVDLAALDVLRDRERGLPRYNAFRRHLSLKPIERYDELGAENVKALRSVYGRRRGKDGRWHDRVDDIDLQIGLLAEPKPEGFGFSDTAFRVFILMAARRLHCDRFYAEDFNAEVYTEFGRDWIAGRTLAGVLRQHYPALRPLLAAGANPFAPWECATGR